MALQMDDETITADTTFDASDIPNIIPRFDARARPAIQAVVVSLLDSLAERKDATAAQIALVWLPVQQPCSAPNSGARQDDRLDEHIGAAGIALMEDELRKIDVAAAAITVEGAATPST
jgi:aryl-alcohol dehydrogenase-like predicted oxidoreductase